MALPPNSAPRLLLVEDEPVQRGFLAGVFATAGYGVLTVTSMEEARAALVGPKFDLVVLDLGLPDGSGYELVPVIRRRPTTGVIILTSRDDQSDRIHGLELGADDYLTKPFHPQELLLRVRNVLRRGTDGGGKDNPGLESPASYRFAGWRFGPTERLLRGPDGVEIPVTASEARLLEALVRQAGVTVSRRDLLAALGHMPDGNTRAVDWLVLRVRRKLKEDARNPSIVVGVRGVGYRFAVEVDAELDRLCGGDPGRPTAVSV